MKRGWDGGGGLALCLRAKNFVALASRVSCWQTDGNSVSHNQLNYLVLLTRNNHLNMYDFGSKIVNKCC